MKFIAMTLALALSFGALAQDAAKILTPSPLGVVIAAYSYLNAERKKVYYIKVQSSGKTFEQARQQGFRLASEQIAGTLVLSESELKNTQLTRDEIVTYSSGIVDKYNIIRRDDTGNSVNLVMEVWVAESDIAQRLLARSTTERGIDGDALSVRAETILDERQRGDEIIRTVLNDFPKRAFRVKLEPANISMDIYRNARAVIAWEVKWDDRYVNAFSEAASNVGKRPCWWNCPSTQQFYLNQFQLDDPAKLIMVIDHVKRTKATLKVELYDLHGNLVNRTCQSLAVLQEDWGSPYPNSALVTTYPNSVIVGGRSVVTGQTQFTFGKNTAIMASLDQIKAEVVTRSQCRPV